MKRQKTVFKFVITKVTRTEISKQEASEDVTQPTLLRDTNETSAFDDVKPRGKANDASALPDCWSMEQYENFKKKYDGLIVHSKKLGCDHCAKFKSESLHRKGIHVSIEWASCSIVGSGRNKTIQQASLRKKMSEHFLSTAHSICVQRLQDCEEDPITKCMDKVDQKDIDSTNRVFNTVYSLAKRGRPFSDVEDEIDLQIKNGVDMGVGLHSRKTVVKIVDHIAKEIKKKVFNKIIEQNLKISVIIDEASTIFSKPVVVFFLKIEDCELSPTIFLDLVELEGQEAETIYTSLLNSLHCAGFDGEYLRNNLIAFCSDAASVMLGRNSGVGTRLKNDFPNVVIWDCLDHRLQLVLNNPVIPQTVQKAKNIISTIAVGSAEAEKGFSRMNITYTDKKSRLSVENVANLMTINLIGLPLDSWDATPFVKKWLRKNYSADDKVKKKKAKDYDDNQVAIWKFLQ